MWEKLRNAGKVFNQIISEIGKSYVQKSCLEISQKVGLYNKKTKIYQTIKGLIILFIKPQFSNKVQSGPQIIVYLNL